MDDVSRKTILLVDDNMTNLTTGRELLRDRYRVYPAPSAEVMFNTLENIIPDLILLDIEMPDMDGYQAIKILKDNPKWNDIPVIFLTARTDEGSELEGLSLGAIDYVFKPFIAPLLLKRIENHLLSAQQKKQLRDFNINLEQMVQKKTEQIFNLQNAVLGAVANMVEFRDDVTGGHVARTQEFLRLLIEGMVEDDVYTAEMSDWDMDYMLPSAQLHDIGKIAIPDAILYKPDKLTYEEFEIMKTHTTLGVEAIERIETKTMEHDFLRHAERIVGAHHEKWDGSGYPLGLSGSDIPLEGRLMAVSDVYDALISARPYKPPFSNEEAIDIITKGSGSHFDPTLIEVFLKVVDRLDAAAKRINGAKG